MNTFIRLFTDIDIFGSPILFRINKRTTSKTFFGGILTSILMLFLSVVGLIMLDSSLKHKTPRGTVEIFFKPYPFLTLNSTVSPFAFSVSDENNIDMSNIVKKYFNFTFRSKLYNSSAQSIISTDLKLERCTGKHFPNLNQQLLTNPILQSSFCPILTDYEIFGAWEQPELQFLSLEVFPCQNDTKNNNTCPSIEEMQDFILQKVYYVNIILLNEQINTYEYINYSSFNIIQYYKAIMPKIRKVLEVYISPVVLDSDYGFLYEMKEEYNAAQFEKVAYDENTFTVGSSIIEIDIYASKNTFIYHRSYMKLPEILASLGGMSKALQVFSTVLASFYSIIKQNEHMLNKMFDFDLLQKDNNHGLHSKSLMDIQFPQNEESSTVNFNTSKKNKITKIIRQKFKNSVIKPHNQKEEDPTFRSEKSDIQTRNDYFIGNYNKNLEGLIQIIKRKAHPPKTLKFQFREFVSYTLVKFCVSKGIKDKFNLYYKSCDVLHRVLDITYMIEKMEELERMKLLVLSKEQLALFGFISKCVFSESKDKENFSQLTQLRFLDKDVEYLAKLIHEFKEKVNHKGSLTPIDKKLFSFLSEDIKKYFF
jgi:hypothetical protein